MLASRFEDDIEKRAALAGSNSQRSRFAVELCFAESDAAQVQRNCQLAVTEAVQDDRCFDSDGVCGSVICFRSQRATVKRICDQALNGRRVFQLPFRVRPVPEFQKMLSREQDATGLCRVCSRFVRNNHSRGSGRFSGVLCFCFARLSLRGRGQCEARRKQHQTGGCRFWPTAVGQPAVPAVALFQTVEQPAQHPQSQRQGGAEEDSVQYVVQSGRSNGNQRERQCHAERHEDRSRFE